MQGVSSNTNSSFQTDEDEENQQQAYPHEMPSRRIQQYKFPRLHITLQTQAKGRVSPRDKPGRVQPHVAVSLPQRLQSMLKTEARLRSKS